MSRIHEALQRAYLERGKLSVSEDIHVTEPRMAPVVQEQPEAKAEVVLENMTEYSWKPSLLSFPTLADRGAAVEQFRSLRSHIYQARRSEERRVGKEGRY